MNEPALISSLFTKLYNGSPWLEINIVDSLSNITAAQAAKRGLENCNTIWELVNHLIEWRLNVLRRVNGEVIITPDHNYILPVSDTSEAAWQHTLQRLREAQHKWITFLDHADEEDFSKEYPVNKLTYYEHIHGIIQHDAYHLGQIVLLKKFVDA